MNITPEQLANAAKALGVDSIDVDFDKRGVHLAFPLTKGESPEDETEVLFGPGFAEWAVPRLEYDHGDAINIWPDSYEGNGKNTSWMASGGDNYGSGPDIDTAVLLLAAKIGEGME